MKKSTNYSIIKMIILMYVIRSYQQNQITCSFKIISSGITIGKLINEFLYQSWRFDKNLITRSFKDIKNTYKECKGYIPDKFEADDCVEQMSYLAEQLEIIYEKFDVELFEEGIMQLVYNCPTVIKLYDYCLNSKLINNKLLNQLIEKKTIQNVQPR